jgi:hypothetical protein
MCSVPVSLTRVPAQARVQTSDPESLTTESGSEQQQSAAASSSRARGIADRQMGPVAGPTTHISFQIGMAAARI